MWIEVNRSILSADQACKNPHARARWLILVNAQNERHFKIQKWLFWLLPGFFKHWKNQYFLICFLQKRRASTIVLSSSNLCSNGKISSIFFLGKLTFLRTLKQPFKHFPWSTCTAKRYHWLHQGPFRITLQKTANFAFLCKIVYTTCGGKQY